MDGTVRNKKEILDKEEQQKIWDNIEQLTSVFQVMCEIDAAYDTNTPISKVNLLRVYDRFADHEQVETLWTLFSEIELRKNG